MARAKTTTADPQVDVPLHEELAAVTKERDDLREELAAVTKERDDLRAALEMRVFSGRPFKVTGEGSRLIGEGYVQLLELEAATADGVLVKAGDVVEVKTL